MKTHIIVDGRRDKELLERLLSDLPATVERRIEAAGSKDAARPLVRKHLLRAGEPTAFVFDTDTTDRMKVREQLHAFEHYFGSPVVPFAMFPMVPALEVLFFERPATLERRLGKPLDRLVQRAGAHAPAQVLEEMLPELGASSVDAFLQSLSPAEVEDLRKVELIVKLHRFVEEGGA